ncbi:alpha/beta hydrolase, partial [Nocardia gipuzkoensis]
MSYDVLLSLRSADRGGGKRDSILEELRPDRGRPMVLFVHGFNVNRSRALEQWAALARYLAPKSRVQRGPLLWPSDMLRSRSLSRVTYPMIVPLAQQCGRKLGDYLRRRPDQRCVLIGHSLGALVVLEAAYRFRTATILDGLG